METTRNVTTKPKFFNHTTHVQVCVRSQHLGCFHNKGGILYYQGPARLANQKVVILIYVEY